MNASTNMSKSTKGPGGYPSTKPGQPSGGGRTNGPRPDK